VKYFIFLFVSSIKTLPMDKALILETSQNPRGKWKRASDRAVACVTVKILLPSMQKPTSI
jgi:hypothetical protein